MKPSLIILASCLIGCYLAFFLVRDPVGPAAIPLSAWEQGLCWLGLLMMAPALVFAVLIPVQPAIIPVLMGTVLAAMVWPWVGRIIMAIYRKKIGSAPQTV